MEIGKGIIRGVLAIVFGGLGLYTVVWGLFAGVTEFLNEHVTYGYALAIGSVIVTLILYYAVYWFVEPFSRHWKRIIILVVLLMWVVSMIILVRFIPLPQ